MTGSLRQNTEGEVEQGDEGSVCKSFILVEIIDVTFTLYTHSRYSKVTY